jgi:hypothetical protein
MRLFGGPVNVVDADDVAVMYSLKNIYGHFFP